jgi:Uncharacterized conserved protein (DUF2190)
MGLHNSLRGKDLHSPSNELVENNTGAAIAALKVVTFPSMGRTYPNIALANGSTDIVRGITQTSIAAGSTGYITALGFLIGINTGSWSSGTTLYCDAYGSLTTVANGSLPVATVLKQDPVYGQIYVNAVGVTQADIANSTFPPEAELEWMFSIPHSRPYQTFSYNINSDMVDMDVYSDNTKSVHVFNRHFTYDISGRLVTVVTTNLLTGLSKTKSYNYDINGYMVSVQES